MKSRADYFTGPPERGGILRSFYAQGPGCGAGGERDYLYEHDF